MKNLLSRLSPRLSWALVLLLMATSVVWIVLDWQAGAAAALVHRVTAVSAQFQLLNTWTQAPPALPPVVGNGRLVLVTGEEKPGLQALDVHTGGVAWQQDADTLTRPHLWPETLGWSAPFSYRWSGLVADGERVYAVEAYGLRTAVSTYDLLTGQKLWDHKLGSINGSDADYTALVGDYVVVRINEGDYNEFFGINRNTGWLDIRQNQEAYPIFWLEKEPPRLYEVVASGVRLAGVWQRTFASCGITPQVYQDVLLLQLHLCESSLSQLLALNRFTGDVLWELAPPIVGNVALSQQGISFALSPDGTLRAMDAQTGVGAGFVTLAPALQPVVDVEAEEVVFYVAAQGEDVALYTGDSRQVFTFRYNATVP